MGEVEGSRREIRKKASGRQFGNSRPHEGKIEMALDPPPPYVFPEILGYICLR